MALVELSSPLNSSDDEVKESTTGDGDAEEFRRLEKGANGRGMGSDGQENLTWVDQVMRKDVRDVNKREQVQNFMYQTDAYFRPL